MLLEETASVVWHTLKLAMYFFFLILKLEAYGGTGGTGSIDFYVCYHRFMQLIWSFMTSKS